MRYPTRSDDERLLYMLRLRSAGMRPARIAEWFGCGVQYVSTATNRVLRADAAQSGERVAEGYW